MIGEDAGDQVRETLKAIETERVLLGFMGQPEAVQRLQMADNLRNPIDPGKLDEEELQTKQAEKQEEYVETWEEAKSALASPAPFRDEEVELQELPDEEPVQEHITEFTDQEKFQEVVGGLADENWAFKRVPIESLVAFQPNITTTAYDEIPTSDHGLTDVLEYCFPIEGTDLLMRQQLQTPDNSFIGVQFISRSPNIQVAGMEVSQQAEQRGSFVTFHIKSQPNFVQVAHFQDRYLLKNGYHRVFQLLEAGETHVPAVVREVDTFQETGGQKDGFFGQELVMGPRPPLMQDFQTDVAVDLDKPGTNKVIRVLAETTNILR